MSLRYLLLLFYFSLVSGEVYNVKVKTDQHINEVDNRFLSFTIDPKYLFDGKLYNSQECLCMASAMMPAYLRVAGPSTTELTIQNNTIIIGSDDKKVYAEEHRYATVGSGDIPCETNITASFSPKEDAIKVSSKQWQKFMKWANTTGLDLVFAINNKDRTASGVWDTTSALGILRAVDQLGVNGMFWQLGYECKNQSIEEYLIDVETLRVLTEGFPPGWRVVGGDVAPCLRQDTTSDFRDYIALAHDMMDAIFLNGNSSAQELDRMPEPERVKLVTTLSNSELPLWVTERSQQEKELERAVEWLAGLGYAAKNGFSVYFHELVEEELYEPTLSFYMALLYKRLVGPRALDLAMSASDAILFAHCTSLRGSPVSRAVTLFGANMADEPQRFSLQLSRREEGGDIMQFILGHDDEGNIVVNSEVMYYEGDIKPVLKRVGPYKTLLIRLPPKTFGFWVLANTKVEACNDLDTSDSIEIVPLSEESVKVKRSIFEDKDIGEESLDDSSDMLYENVALKDRIDGINKDLRNIQRLFEDRMNKDALRRLKREVSSSKKYLNRIKAIQANKRDLKLNSNILDKILDATDIAQLVDAIKNKFQRNKNRKRNTNKRQSKVKSAIKKRTGPKKYKTQVNDKSNQNRKEEKIVNQDLYMKDNNNVLQKIEQTNEEYRNNNLRKRRSVGKSKAKNEVDSMENTIDLSSKESIKLSKILSKIKEISKVPLDVIKTDNDYEYDDKNDAKSREEDGGMLGSDILEYANLDIFKSTIHDLLKLFSDFNQNLKTVWSAVTHLE